MGTLNVQGTRIAIVVSHRRNTEENLFIHDISEMFRYATPIASRQARINRNSSLLRSTDSSRLISDNDA